MRPLGCTAIELREAECHGGQLVPSVSLPKGSEPFLGGARSDTAPFCRVPRALACSQQGARGDQTYRGGHEGLDSLSAAALELLATTQLSRAHLLLLLGFAAARATLTLAGGRGGHLGTGRPGSVVSGVFGLTSVPVALLAGSTKWSGAVWEEGCVAALH